MNSYYQTYTALASAAAFFFREIIKKITCGQTGRGGAAKDSQQRGVSHTGNESTQTQVRKKCFVCLSDGATVEGGVDKLRGEADERGGLSRYPINKDARHARTKRHTRGPLVLGIKQCE